MACAAPCGSPTNNSSVQSYVLQMFQCCMRLLILLSGVESEVGLTMPSFIKLRPPCYRTVARSWHLGCLRWGRSRGTDVTSHRLADILSSLAQRLDMTSKSIIYAKLLSVDHGADLHRRILGRSLQGDRSVGDLCGLDGATSGGDGRSALCGTVCRWPPPPCRNKGWARSCVGARRKATAIDATTMRSKDCVTTRGIAGGAGAYKDGTPSPWLGDRIMPGTFFLF
jgi:hypothetical protein